MKILIIGYGAVGSILVDLLSKEQIVTSILCGVLGLPKKRKQHKKVKFVRVNAYKDDDAVKYAKQADLLINAAKPDFNRQLLSACLTAKTNYMDMASYWEYDKRPRAKCFYRVEQLDFNDRFKKKGLIGIINAGASPGLTNLLAREGAEQLDTVNAIKLRLVEDMQSENIYFPWDVEWVLDEYSAWPIVYQNGIYKKMDHFSGMEKFKFPAPIGERTVDLISQEEVGTIPLYIKTKSVDIKASDSPSELGKYLYKLGLLQEKPTRIRNVDAILPGVKEKNVKISPYYFTSELLTRNAGPHQLSKHIREDALDRGIFVVSVEVAGERSGRKRLIKYSVVFPSQKQVNKIFFGANYISYPAALLTKIFAMSVPNIQERGVFPPENLGKEARTFVLRELKRSRIRVVKTVRVQ